MLKNKIINLKIIERVALALGEINKKVVYVGGAVASLYATDEGAEQPRPTKDIDISIQISSYAQMEEFRKKLAVKNIYPASSEDVLYRFHYKDILIDFIPFEDTPLGPTNKWLKNGFGKAFFVNIGETEIKILPVSYYLATKWEAFINRGSDPRTSSDFEDIIYVIDNNLDLINEILETDIDVYEFLKEMSHKILSNEYLNEIIECHLNPVTADQRKKIVINKLKQISTIRN